MSLCSSQHPSSVYHRRKTFNVCVASHTRTHSHTDTDKTLRNRTEIADDCVQKDNRFCSSVGAWHSSASSFKVSATVWEKAAEKLQQTTETRSVLCSRLSRQERLVLTPLISNMPQPRLVLVSLTALSEAVETQQQTDRISTVRQRKFFKACVQKLFVLPPGKSLF